MASTHCVVPLHMVQQASPSAGQTLLPSPPPFPRSNLSSAQSWAQGNSGYCMACWPLLPFVAVPGKGVQNRMHAAPSCRQTSSRSTRGTPNSLVGAAFTVVYAGVGSMTPLRSSHSRPEAAFLLGCLAVSEGSGYWNVATPLTVWLSVQQQSLQHPPTFLLVCCDGWIAAGRPSFRFCHFLLLHFLLFF